MADKDLRRILVDRLPTAEQQHIDDFEESTYYWTNRNNASLRLWCRTTYGFLTQEHDKIDTHRFIIHVHGILGEIYRHLETKVRSLKRVFKTKSEDALIHKTAVLKDPRMAFYCRALILAFVECKAIRENFSDDQIFKIGFFRHSVCHPVLTDYAMKIDERTFNPKKYHRFRRLIDIDNPRAVPDLFDEVFPIIQHNGTRLLHLDGLLLQMSIS